MSAQVFYTVADLLAAQARHSPGRPAVIDGATTVSYKELHDQARRWAGLIARRVEAQSRIALLLPRTARALAAYFGACLAGAVPVFVNEQLRARQASRIVDHAGASLVITDRRCRRLLRDSAIRPDQVVEAGAPGGPPIAAPEPVIGKDLAGLIYTSGSTGSPRGVMVTHDNLVAGAAIVADYLGLTSQDRTIAALPWSFDYGLNQVLATFIVGGAVVVQRSAFPPDICRTLSSAAVTGMAAVPSLWAALTRDGSPLSRRRLPSLRYVTNSGGPLAPAAVERIRSAQPHVDVYLMYGLTEAFRSTCLEPAMAGLRPGSIGKAVPNTEILVVGDDGRPCAPGVAGELVHRGPTVAAGYWRDPEATAAVFRPHPFPLRDGVPETVVFSGDWVKADAEGYLHFVGRRDEQFKSRGIRVTPTEIEAELLASGLLSEAVVVAVSREGPDPELVAAVVPQGPGLALSELRAYCQAELPGHMLPHRFVPMPRVPADPERQGRPRPPARRAGRDGRRFRQGRGRPMTSMTWSPQVRRLLEPLADFDRLHAETVRRAGSSVVDLSYPNPRLSVDRRPYQALAELAANVGVDDLRHSPFGGFTTVRRNVAAALSRRHEMPYTFRDVILTPGATAAINVILLALLRPGGRAAVICPCWMDYPLHAVSAGLGCDLVPAGPGKRLDLAGVERAWTPDTVGLIISQPASPTGVLYTGDELAGLAATLRRLGQRHGHAPLLVSDEAHRDQVWSGARFASPALFYPETVSVYSFGKAWEMPGQRVGYAAVSPRWPGRKTARERLEAGMRVTGHCAPAALTQHLASALAGYTPRLGPIADLQRHARGRLRDAGYEVVAAQATRFVYAQAPIADDTQFVRALARRGVLAMPSAVFHEPGHFRLALNVADAALDRALDVLAGLHAGGSG